MLILLVVLVNKIKINFIKKKNKKKISTDCARAFTLLHRLNLRYGLCCFGFHGYTVVYPVPNKSAFTRKLIIRTFGLYLQV